MCSGKIKNLEAKVVMLGSQGVGKTRDDDIWGTKNADVATTSAGSEMKSVVLTTGSVLQNF